METLTENKIVKISKILKSLLFISLLSLFISPFSSKASAKDKIERYDNFKSNFVSPRNIDVYLPPDYNDGKAHPVLYMHDGQNLFDPKTSYIGVDWGVSETVSKLVKEKKINSPIVVGIWNTSLRMSEYMPQKPFEMITPEKKEKFEEIIKKDLSVEIEPVISDNYLKFIVQELKPFIDSNFKTLKDRDNTFIMGSSMGGLISLYALTEYPDVFGGAGCISTHWPAGEGIVIEYMKSKLPKPGNHKIYFDYGTKTTDAEYEPFQLKMDEVMEKAGYTSGKDWITIKFNGEEHSERAWRRRLHIPIIFLLGK